MNRLDLPRALLALAIVIALVGIRRLSASSDREHSVGRALIVWFVLFASGATMWLWQVFHDV